MTHPKHILPGEPIPRGSLFHERRYRVAKTLLNNLKYGDLLLDIGCGNASQTEYFAQNVIHAIGLDLQHSRLPGFRDDLNKRNIQNITLTGGDAECLPFQDASFAYVTCFEVLEHVKNQVQVLSEIRRVLKPEGMVFLSVPNRWWIFETHGADLPLLPWNRVPFFSWLPKKIHDAWARARIYTAREIQNLMIKCGFTAVETRLLTAPMDVVKAKWLQNLLRNTIFRGDTNIIPFLSSTIFACAKKNT